MSLTPGTSLGPYEVSAQIGEGGMGAVYRARDTKLNRDVALKVLLPEVASAPERLARFRREAQTLAALNHPHIGGIYGLEESGGTIALVLELVDGPTLADRLAQGAIPPEEAFPIAMQIAEALEAAHERGIIHRDLKPANVKVTPDGSVKILDFGLAKAMEGELGGSGANSRLAHSPTMSRQMTEAGMILGTAAYMSPEQARGKTVDARADIWAFGVVVFEMLTGTRLFVGETVSDTVAAVLTRDPDWSLLPAGSIPWRRLLARCLTRDAKRRFHSIADVRIELEELSSPSQRVDDAAALPSGRRHLAPRERMAWGALAAVLALALAVAGWGPWSAGNPQGPLRVSILPSEGGEVGIPAISPDGRRVAYAARRADGMPVIWVRDLDQSTPRALAGTEGGNRLFWSPDSKRLGFIVGRVLKHVSADGGPVREIARRVGIGGAWAADDTIIFSGPGGDLRRISASGGEDAAATVLPGPDWEHMFPSILPDGRHFLFTAKHWVGLAETGAQGIYLGSIDNPSGARQLLPELSSAVYAAPGYVVFARDGRLMAAAFDPGSERITGEPVDLGEAVASESTHYVAAIGAATDGTLAIRPSPAPVLSAALGRSGSFDAELAFLRRDGTVASRFGGVQPYTFYAALSPDERTVVAHVADPGTSLSDLWSIDTSSGTATRLTSMRAGGNWVGSPVWAHDGSRLAFACQAQGSLDDICVRDMTTGTVTTVVESKNIWEHPRAWSPDGQYMLVAFDDYGADSKEQLRVWAAKTGALLPYIESSDEGIFSPDGRFVAYDSTETGRREVSVTTFPERRQTWPLTTDGGDILSWSADGREILVASLSGHVVAYPVTTIGGVFSAGAPQILIRNVGFDAKFSRATRDHSRILVRMPKGADQDRGEIRLLFGWQHGLR